MINGVPRILLIRLSAIGDVVRVLPALHTLRDRYPDAQIDFAVEPKSSEVLEGHPAIDQVLVFGRTDQAVEGTKAFVEFCKDIRQNRYDIAIDFHGILKSGLILKATGAKQRYAFAPPRAQEMSHLFAKTKVKLITDRMNRIDENLELVKALDCKKANLDVVIHIPDEVQDDIDAWMEDTFHGGKHHILIHAPVDRVEKQWPLKYYAMLADELLADGRYEVTFTWGPGQKAVVDEVVSMMDRMPVVAPETESLKHFAAMVLQADLYFGGDTGPMHIASAMGTPVVAVFGGTDPNMHAPLRQPSEVLYAGPARPAKAIDLENAATYLQEITPKMAYEACIRMLHSRPE